MHISRQYTNERDKTMDCQEMEELLGAYALEALSAEERKAADAHLADCVKCTHTLQQLKAIVDLFPLSVPPMEPAPRVKAQLLARIQEDEQRKNSLPPTVLRQRPPVRGWRAALLAASMLVLLLLCGTSFLWNLSLRQQLAQSPVVYQLHGTGNSTTATGQVIYYTQQDITVVMVYKLPSLTGNQVYQGWLLRGSQPVSIGLFNINHGVATLGFQGNLNGFDATAVSLEQGPVASQGPPQGPVVVAGTLMP